MDREKNSPYRSHEKSAVSTLPGVQSRQILIGKISLLFLLILLVNHLSLIRVYALYEARLRRYCFIFPGHSRCLLSHNYHPEHAASEEESLWNRP